MNLLWTTGIGEKGGKRGKEIKKRVFNIRDLIAFWF